MRITNERTQGLAYALAAFGIWGFLPLFFNLFSKTISAYEILAHRVIWSLFLMLGVIVLFGRLKGALNLLITPKTRGMLFLSGSLIAINWGVYVYAVSNGKILDASIGYFINPLMNMLLGWLVFKEQLNLPARVAIAIVVVAIALQIYALGELPLIAIVLPGSFAIYGAIRKRVKVPALEGLFAETLLLFPLAVGYILWLVFSGASHFKFDTNGALMVISGLITVVPLLAFTAATTRISLSTIGYLQYLSPTIGMALGVLVFGEHLSALKFSSFALIWLALALVALSKAFEHKNLKRT